MIVKFYDLLLALSENPMVKFNRAVAVSERDGPKVGLKALLALKDLEQLKKNVLFYAAVGDCHRLAGDNKKS